MAESTTEVQSDDQVLTEIAKLGDLFSRRLKDDKDKRAIIQQLFERLERAEQTAAGDHLRPIVARFGLLLERIREVPIADQELLTSFSDELCEALDACFGITEVPVKEFDPRYHEVAHVVGEGPVVVIAQVLRPGFLRGERVIRQARVVLRRHPARSDD